LIPKLKLSGLACPALIEALADSPGANHMLKQ
jgi:hypothetical protein